MNLTTQQIATLKADIQADSVLNALPNNADSDFAIAAAYNTVATPDFWVWKTRLPKSDIVESVSPDGTTFSWVGNGYITRAQGERDAFLALFSSSGVCNPSLANVRSAFTDIFSGTGQAASNRTHISAVSRRRSTRGEKLFATGTGSTASPAVMVFEGAISADDVQTARNS